MERVFSEFEYNSRMRNVILEKYGTLDGFVRFAVKDLHDQLEQLGKHDTRKGKAKLINFMKTMEKSRTPEVSLISKPRCVNTVLKK